MPNKIHFESEFILHAFTQKHLKELFDMELVASEKQLYNLQPDNLAFNKSTNSLAIIEYKNKCDKDVLDQTQRYYDSILEHKSEYSKLVDEAIENIQIIIIGPEFSDKQIKSAKDNVNLWKVTLFDDCRVEYLNLKNGEIKTLCIRQEDLKITEEKFA